MLVGRARLRGDVDVQQRAEGRVVEVVARPERQVHVVDGGEQEVGEGRQAGHGPRNPADETEEMG